MATLNKPTKAPRTHEGAVACHLTPEQELRRSVMACLLWEDHFYEDGISIANRITGLIKRVSPAMVAGMAVEARKQMKLRHVPLLLAAGLARRSELKAGLLEQIIQRADELTEFLAVYWRDGRCPLAAQVKKGLARAFTKFDAYQLGKYNRDNAIKLRDVLFLCHAKPKDEEQAAIWKQLIDGELQPPDTWEVSLSAGKDKKETWERLLGEKRLGGLALLRNLRNMANAKVDESQILASLRDMKTGRILPFRFIAAARYAPQWESAIESAMFKSCEHLPRLVGKTVILVDVSGSMDSALSSKSDMTRIDAACGVAVCAREICTPVAVYSFSYEAVRVPDRRGFALRDAIKSSQTHGGTYLGRALQCIQAVEEYDRIIVVTDEQSHDAVSAPNAKGYLINVASYKNGVGYDKWLHIDGFSEAVLNYIHEYESSFETQ